MGIPSYFSYIVKNHPEIIQKFVSGEFPIDNLYMDCNSIIYDCYHLLSEDERGSNITNTLIKNVINKIERYVDIVSPKKRVIVSFDGVAPVAKLEQQRTRRFKTWFQTNLTDQLCKKPDPSWSTASITPGTNFMKQLNKQISTHFSNKKNSSKYSPTIIVSTSDEPGEGEHKIFSYIRNNVDHSSQTTVIYGLDADLIMLSVNHYPLCKEIYLFRETPEFIKSIDSSLEPNDNYLFNIEQLTGDIVLDMQKEINFSQTNANKRIYDYIFMCFLLGNDFLPHFPAVNIRSGGIMKLLQHYKSTLGSSNKFIVDMDKKKIIWKNFRLLIESLAIHEQEYMITEHTSRDKKEKHSLYASHHEKNKIDRGEPMNQDDKIKAFLEKIQNIPSTERSVEKYISPEKECWENRYYAKLLDVDMTSPERVRQVCINYLEGLEWTFKYYMSDCPNWRWKYNYHYPPLLKDLINHIPYFDTTFIAENMTTPVEQVVQLCYVLPKKNLSLLPYKIYNQLHTKYDHCYPERVDFEWSYCKYFWEAHPKLPMIDINVLETAFTKTVS